MKDSPNIPVNYQLLRWAREEAGLSLKEAASRAKIGGLKPRGEFPGMEPWQRLEQWETGQKTPSANQLLKIAKAYRRPVLTFFLQQAPVSISNIQDYRTLGDRPAEEMDSPEFAAFRRRLVALQLNVKDLAEKLGTKPLSFVGSIDTNIAVKDAVKNIRNELGFSFEDQRKISNKENLFRELRYKIENLGVFLIAEANLGSWHTDIEPDIFRGMTISDELAPFIIINPKDSPAARIFTLVHELTHVWMGDTAISNLDSLAIDHAIHRNKEKYCNEVAAEFLVPESALRDAWAKMTGDDTTRKIQKIAASFKVSTICLSRRLIDFNLVTRKFYWDFYHQYLAQLKAIKKKQSKTETGPSRIVLNRFRLGFKLIHTVIDAAHAGIISELDASQLLGVKINKFADIYPSAV